MSFEISSEFSIESAIDAEAERRKADEDLGRTDFLTMLVAQLEHQDPLNPQDASEFSAQLAQFSSLEQLISMKASLDQLVAAQNTTEGERDVLGEDLMAANLLGKEVAAFDTRLEVQAQGESQTIRFYLDGPASDVSFDVRDENGDVLFTINAIQYDEDGSVVDGGWQAGLNEFEWQRPTGADDYVRGPSDVFFDVVASLGQAEVRGEGVTLGTVVASSLGFDATALEFADGRKIDLENVFEVRRTQAGL